MATLNLGRVRLNFKGEFSALNGTDLEFFDAVTHSGSLYVVTATGITTVNDTDTGNRPPSTTGQSSFKKITEGFQFHTAWNDNKIYYKNDIVFYANTSYIAIAEVPTSTSNPATEVANATGYWAPLAQGFGNYISTYNGTTALAEGDMVRWQGSLYRAKTATTNSQTPSNTAASFDVVIPGFDPQGTWSAGTYVYRQVVEFHGKSYVVVAEAGTTQQPLNATTGLIQSDWRLLIDGFKFVGDYDASSSDGYYAGDMIDFNNVLYAVTGRLPSGTTPIQAPNEVNLILQAPTLDIQDLGNVSTTNVSTGSLLRYNADNKWHASDVNQDLDISPFGSTGTIIVGSDYHTRGAFSSHSLAPKAYVDSLSNGLDVKASCKVATTQNLPSNYSFVTFSLTSTANAALVIDSVTLQVNDRILVKDQTDQTQNGFYYVTDTGSASTPWVIKRTEDADSSVDVTGGSFTFIEQGSVNANNGFVATHNGSPTFGTTDITFEQFSGAGQIDAGAGLVKAGNTLTVQTDNSTLEINNDIVRIKDQGVVNAKIANTTIDLTAKVTNQLPVANGGTGLSTVTSNAILYGNGTGNLQTTTAGTGGYILYSNSGTPDWTNVINGGIYGTGTGTTTGFLAKIKPKRSEVSFEIPSALDIEEGELAVNTVDKKIYVRDSNNAIIEIGNTEGGGGAAADDGFINALIFG